MRYVHRGTHLYARFRCGVQSEQAPVRCCSAQASATRHTQARGPRAPAGRSRAMAHAWHAWVCTMASDVQVEDHACTTLRAFGRHPGPQSSQWQEPAARPAEKRWGPPLARPSGMPSAHAGRRPGRPGPQAPPLPSLLHPRARASRGSGHRVPTLSLRWAPCGAANNKKVKKR